MTAARHGLFLRMAVFDRSGCEKVLYFTLDGTPSFDTECVDFSRVDRRSKGTKWFSSNQVPATGSVVDHIMLILTLF